MDQLLEEQDEDLDYSEIAELKKELIQLDLVDQRAIPLTFSNKKITDKELRVKLEEQGQNLINSVQSGGLGLDGVYDKNSEKRSLCRLILLGLSKPQPLEYEKRVRSLSQKLKTQFDKQLHRQIRREKALSVIGSTFNSTANSTARTEFTSTGFSGQFEKIQRIRSYTSLNLPFERMIVRNNEPMKSSSRENFFKVINKSIQRK